MDFEKICPDCFEEGMEDGVCTKCGYVPKNRSDRCLPLFHLLSERYIVGKVLGVGGFGITYKGYDIYNNDVCAIKEYVPMNISVRMPGDVNVTPVDDSHKGYFSHGQKRFIEEAEFLKALSGMREIVNITDYFNENNTSYFVMEFLEGENLKSLYRNYRRQDSMIPYEFCCRVIVQIGRALEKIHKQSKIFHRDISPENIFITTSGDIKLIDFGNAKHCTQEESQNISVVLKPGFAPPEQYSTTGVQGPWTDVYSLACTFYLIVCGESIPPAPDRLQGVEYKPMYKANPLVTMDVSNVVDMALKLNYRDRLKDVSELVNVLDEYLGDSATDIIEYTDGEMSRMPEPEIPYDAPKSDMTFSICTDIMPYVKVIQGDQAGNRWYLPPDVEIMLGRSQTMSNIVLSEYAQISNRHCTVTYSLEHKGFLVKDLSTNGTFVNGKRLEKECYYLIDPGSQLALSWDTCILEIGVEKNGDE